MSWFLKNKKKSLFYVAVITVIILLTIIFKIEWYIITSICIFVCFLFLLNECVFNKINKYHIPFLPNSEIRNVDYLVIGEFIDVSKYVPEGCSHVRISAPSRSYNSSWQILRHTHSILKENGGTVIISAGKSKRDFTIFDVPFLHRITIKKFHLEYLAKLSKFPIFISPIDSLFFLLNNNKSSGKYDVIYPPEELSDFCRERNYSLIYLVSDPA